VHYFDSSALVKLVIDEEESDVLRAFERRIGRVTTSELVRVEVPRAVGRTVDNAGERVAGLLRSLHLIPITGALLDQAGRLAPSTLRSLDAIHLASALLLQDDLEAFVAYDDRLLDAASALGMPVAAPA
jgi:predicted nucleic acid-binding protein